MRLVISYYKNKINYMDIEKELVQFLKSRGFDYCDTDILNNQTIFRNGDVDVVFEIIEHEDEL